jgi:hypothetical protein
MGKLSKILTEVLSSTYIKIIKNLTSQIDWNDVDQDFIDINKSSKMLINDIENIGGYEGNDAQSRLNILKQQARDIIYVLRHMVEHYKNK